VPRFCLEAGGEEHGEGPAAGERLGEDTSEASGSEPPAASSIAVPLLRLLMTQQECSRDGWQESKASNQFKM